MGFRLAIERQNPLVLQTFRRGPPTNIKRTPEEYLLADPERERLLENMKAKARIEWSNIGRQGRENDFVHRYSVERLFQELRRTKQRHNYSGFYNLVHLSSGIVMYSDCPQHQQRKVARPIPVNGEGNCIGYSDLSMSRSRLAFWVNRLGAMWSCFPFEAECNLAKVDVRKDRVACTHRCHRGP